MTAVGPTNVRTGSTTTQAVVMHRVALQPHLGDRNLRGMLVIRTLDGTEIRVPLDQVDSITQVEPGSGDERPTPPHPYLHREGVNRCAACWKERIHPSHTDTAVHS
jgi:hypothetical protein